ncbi:xyloglucan-specific endoglucanase protein [Purpureocillium lilacinum]|nr:xyloglucan-specific endoglucanase protein [Purpureocillium lilacinum]OAQ63931.1 xyloglucan-specific endoglucanase protein [Purpureocillium lilacinum]OAQ77000.1 xyloglucan-specific endoglucanase protein [Purpureocillium lilacinum]GJN75720.1 hypothetical protein PLICBS_009826 [Purpureocillium lilacinum]GJN85497.1 hypothetical protein PLIIFM63780_009064 [Purpureocillium lilacinum]
MLRWLVNFGFLALPIGVTIGILLGLQAQRHATGGPPLFQPPDQPGGAPPVNNKLTYVQSCRKEDGIHPKVKDGYQEFTLNPNQWGTKAGDPGFLCMNVTTFNNQTYPTKHTAPEWTIWWQYDPISGSGNNVHAFPNVKVDGNVFPQAVKDVSQIDFDMQWRMRLDNETGPTDTDALTKGNVNANVAVDMFLDTDKASAQSSEKAKFEIMIWFAALGAGTKAVNEQAGNEVAKYTFNGTDFDLFAGKNGNGQMVLTWKAQKTMDDFHGNLYPFIEEILKLKNADYITDSHYLGYLSFGSEAYFSADPVTFHVPSMAINVQKA